jgi:hypothetical protein
MRDYLFDSDFYKKVFPVDPDLSDVELSGLQVDGKNIYVSIDSKKNFPENVPREWRKRPFNTTQLRFSFLDCKRLRLDCFVASARGSLRITKHDEHSFRIEFVNQDVNLSFECSHVSVSAVSVYLNS